MANFAPADIEKESFRIIAEELSQKGLALPEELAPLIMRVIHATADFDYARSMAFSPDVLPRISQALRGGADIVTDTNMARAGISKTALSRLGGTVHCFMADEDVGREAQLRGVTRAVVSMERAAELASKSAKPLLFAVGNAPTALFEICRLVESKAMPLPVAVIGVPVGFVNVEASKEMLMASGIPYIVSRGRKGGSTVAAAICNAILYGLKDPVNL